MQPHGLGRFSQFGRDQLVGADDLMLSDLTAPYAFSWIGTGGSRAFQVPTSSWRCRSTSSAVRRVGCPPARCTHWCGSDVAVPRDERIAQAHNVSVRQLYKVFRAAGRSLEQHIIDQRLERARSELASPSGRRRPSRPPPGHAASGTRATSPGGSARPTA